MLAYPACVKQPAPTTTETGEPKKMSTGLYGRETPCPDDSDVYPTRQTQEVYHYLRDRRSRAIERNWSTILYSVNEIKEADDHLQAFLEDNPDTPFDIYRPGDILSQDKAGSPVKVR